MSNEDEKWKTTLMWIASVAVSVLCCSAIFVVFASYLMDMKNDMHENSMRLAMIEKRQDAIFAEFDFIHKHVAAGLPLGMPSPTSDGQMAPIGGLAPFPVSAPPVAEQPQTVPTPAPVVAPTPTPMPDAAMTPNSAPVVTPPTVTVPTMPPMPDKK